MCVSFAFGGVDANTLRGDGISATHDVEPGHDLYGSSRLHGRMGGTPLLAGGAHTCSARASTPADPDRAVAHGEAHVYQGESDAGQLGCGAPRGARRRRDAGRRADHTPCKRWSDARNISCAIYPSARALIRRREKKPPPLRAPAVHLRQRGSRRGRRRPSRWAVHRARRGCLPHRRRPLPVPSESRGAGDTMAPGHRALDRRPVVGSGRSADQGRRAPGSAGCPRPSAEGGGLRHPLAAFGSVRTASMGGVEQGYVLAPRVRMVGPSASATERGPAADEDVRHREGPTALVEPAFDGGMPCTGSYPPSGASDSSTPAFGVRGC